MSISYNILHTHIMWRSIVSPRSKLTLILNQLDILSSHFHHIFYEHILLHSSNKHTANTSRIEEVYRCTYIDFWFLFPLFFLITVLRAFHIFHTPHVLSSRDRSDIKKKEESNSEMQKKTVKKWKWKCTPRLRYGKQGEKLKNIELNCVFNFR